MAKAKAVENSEAANDLISTAGTQKQAETGEGSTGTPGTSNAPEPGPKATEGDGKNIGSPEATNEPTLEQKGTAAPFQQPGETKKTSTGSGFEDFDHFGGQNEGTQDVKVKPTKDKLEATIAKEVKNAPLEDLQKLFRIIGAELEARDPSKQINTVTTTESNADDQQHLKNLAKFGEGYVDAKHEDGRETVFSAMAWKNLPQTKDGWKPVVKTPPEVAALKK